MTATNFISIKTLAAELGMDRSHARRFIISLGICPTKRRTEDSGGQLTLTVTTGEADHVRRMRKERGFTDAAKAVEGEAGFFYAIALVPELGPRRVKLGFAEDVEQRLAQHRTAAPTAELLRAWPCKRSWERAVMDALAQHGRLILNEVYEFDDFSFMLDRADDLFQLLADPRSKPDLSDASPLRARQ